MNNKAVFIIIICFLSCFALEAQKTKKEQKQESWIDAYVNEKASIRQTLQKANMPVQSEWMKVGMKAAPFVVDLKGVDRLLLMVWGGPDGNSFDHAVWANARFIKANGSSVWMDEVKPEFVRVGWGNAPILNKNLEDKEIRIAGKGYEHGVWTHAESVIYYPVDGYVRFEAEVGIEDLSRNGSAYFMAYNTFPRERVQKLQDQYPEKFNLLQSNIPDIYLCFLTTDDSVEKGLAVSLSDQVKNGTYFKDQIRQIESEKDIDTRIRRYLELFEKEDALLRLESELAWLNMESVRLAYADMKKQKGFDASKYDPQYQELLSLTKNGFDEIYSGNDQAMDNAKKAITLKRSLLLGNTLLDMDKILVARFNLGRRARSAMAPELGTQSNNWSNQQSARRQGFDADIVELSNLRNDIKIRSIYKPEGRSSITDLKLHWDADRIMFTSIMPDKRWNIFETTMNGGGTATPLVNMVEPDLEFFDGAYLPDGRILAASNVGYQGVPCVNGSDPVGNFVLYDPAKESFRRLTFDQDANWNPTIMHNGRIMYTRWEYTDLTHYFSRIVMHMNPDGTENKALFGSGSIFPNSTFDIQPLPGHSSAFVGIISGHHGVARSGRLILFDPTVARTGVKGMMQEIPYRNRPIIPLVKDELVDDVWPQFIKPYPLDDKYFLVAAKLSPGSLWGIYLVDIFDNVTLIAEYEGEGLISPIPVRKSTVPPVIPDRVKLGDKEATVFIQDIYEGEGLRGVPRGTVKALRVLSYEYAYINSPSDFYAQGIQSGWDIKRLLGTVPVEEDGSVIFKIPSNMPVSLQPLDSEGRAVQWMRSWFTGMPGEVVSCVGCHEDQNKIAIPKRVIASTKAPSKLTVHNGYVRSFTFDYEVQPILDRACVSCHNGDNGKMDLRGGRKDKRGYGTSYLSIHPFINRQGPEADMPVLVPYEYHASTSELVRLLKNGHYNVKLTDEEWRSLYNWIDFNAPDKGRFVANPLNGIEQISRRQELGKKYADGVYVDWQKELEDYAAFLKTKGEIKPEMPEPVKKKDEKEVKVKGWPFDAKQVTEMLATEKEIRKEITLAPGITMVFVRIPAGEFVMGSNNGSNNNRPVSRVKIGKAFWMGEIEVTNEQYNVLFPEHDSRYVDQFWKDHTTPGYPANEPLQPVIRVSWEEAMEYCKQLSQQTGLNITLPTEAQWEWACRAGSNHAFWYGDMNTDFSTKENLADAQLTKMAVSGVDPQPMSKDNPWYPYFNFIPKAEGVDDGNMLQTDARKYETNPFNLYAMHGNVNEWTRSDYLPYPYSEKSGKDSEFKVVRGGSYWERPEYSTSYTRKYFYPWQKVKNVGFRVIIED
ncbi:MAG: SUMF1/EgtB/PvdO family nonheme iron enzyme [Bacteroidales bacterium]|jgi:formylglycine-generating enzyme required for sulfatase activity|nr:SUMF1/EgtB/PvdO family nonheme iron enzyme [Bacteroidales bacterium]